jgi:hypothetical protein
MNEEIDIQFLLVIGMLILAVLAIWLTWPITKFFLLCIWNRTCW